MNVIQNTTLQSQGGVNNSGGRKSTDECHFFVNWLGPSQNQNKQQTNKKCLHLTTQE